MKYAVLITALTASIAAGATLATAYEGGQGMGHRGPGMNFDKIDADGDGQLTREEMMAHMQARFQRADANGDGMVTPEEMRARMRAELNAKIERRISRTMERHDANGDGMLSPEEMKPRRAGRMFNRVDANGDGMISRAEFDAMQEMRGKHREGKKHGWGMDDEAMGDDG